MKEEILYQDRYVKVVFEQQYIAIYRYDGEGGWLLEDVEGAGTPLYKTIVMLIEGKNV
jgi:hypothetical protein